MLLQRLGPSGGRAATVQRRWPRVDDPDAPQPTAARVAQQRPVTDPEGQIGLQPEPGVVDTQGTRVHPHHGRSEVQHGLLGQLVGRGHPDVDQRRRPEGAWGHQGSATPDRGGGATTEVERDPGHATHLRAGDLEGLDAADPDLHVTHREGVAHGDGPLGKRAGDHRPGPADVEAAVDPEPYVGVWIWLGHTAQDLDERPPQVLETRARAPADHHGRCTGQRSATELGPGALESHGRVGQVAARDDEQAVRDAERVQGGEVLGRLRHPGIVGGDDEHDHRHRPDTGKGGGDELLVPRHVDERDLAHPVEIGPAVAELDREAALVLLLEAVGVPPGQGLDQGGLAVVDMTGGGDDVHVRPRS